MKRFLTWVKPTSHQLHIGNYFGAILPLLACAQDPQHKDDEILLFVADMHALTTLHDATSIRRNIIEVVKTYLAAGFDAEHCLIYTSSSVPANAQLAWVLQCVTNIGFMKRMHAYKAHKDQGKEDNLTVGTFTYPILMAADILAYDTHYVPVGKDQKQHVEYARDIAQKFNHTFGETFILPEPYIQPQVATVPGIDGRKMSKSYNNYIGLFDTPDEIRKKVFQITTDALPIEAPKDPDACTLYAIYALFLSPTQQEELRRRYTQGWLSYKELKEELTEKICAFLEPFQTRYHKISDEAAVTMLEKNAQKAQHIAQQKLVEVYQKVGFTQ